MWKRAFIGVPVLFILWALLQVTFSGTVRDPAVGGLIVISLLALWLAFQSILALVLRLLRR